MKKKKKKIKAGIQNYCPNFDQIVILRYKHLKVPHMLIFFMEHLVQGASVIMIVTKDNKAHVLSYSTTKIKGSINGTNAAEALSFVNGLEEAIYLRDNKNLH